MGLKSKLGMLLNRKSWKEFQNDCADPERAQQRVWKEIWDEVGESPYWKKNRPAGSLIPSVDEFPITTYENYRESLQRSFSGKISELSGKEILFWCESSGTTGYKKVFPLTPVYVQQLQRLTKPFSYEVCRHFPQFLNRPMLYFAASASVEKSPAGVDVGFISRFMYLSLSPLLRRSYAFPAELYQSSKVFYEWGSLYAMAQDLCGLFAITPSMIIQMSQNIENNFARNLSILKGEKAWPAGLPPIKVSSRRLVVIEKALSKKPFCLKELWPSLQIITTWKGATCGWQLPELEKYNQGKVLVTDGQYSATEGWMTLPFIDDRVGSVFHPGAHVVEFFPADLEPLEKNIVKPWQLKPGTEYEILLTTAMGFIRYRLYDVVLCKGFEKRSPILEFRYKSGNMISLGETRFSEINFIEAMAQSNFHPQGKWVFAPSSKADRMILHLENEEPGLREKFAAFEKALCQVNPEIEMDYKVGILKRMEISVDPHNPYWQQGTHAQSKQKIILKQPL